MSQITRLTRAHLSGIDAGAAGVSVPTAAMLELPEKAVQFGTGAFLRGFVDAFIDEANARGQFNGRVVLVGSTGSGRDRAFAEQDGLYTLVNRGLVNGVPQESRRIVGAVSRALSAVDEWDAVLSVARQPQLEVVFSNTTEVGIALDESDEADATPPRSFPGKLTRFLYERARTFAFAPSKGVVVVPCELIEHNGDALRQVVLQLADRWGYEPGFARWIEAAVPFCNTLVDRIVPGAPADAEANQLAATLGYRDDLLTTAEEFRQFVIEADDATIARLSFVAGTPGIIVTRDVAPYRQRKVSMLNGAHTVSVSVALLAGCTTVLEAMRHPQVGAFVRHVLLDEIVPVVDAPDAEPFAHAVLERFENPYIRHALVDITLHGTTKLRVRIVPTLIRSAQQRGHVGDGLALGVAAHLALLQGGFAAARRAAGLSVPVDVLGEQIHQQWSGVAGDDAMSVRAFVQRVLADESLWGVDLSVLPLAVDTIARHLSVILSQGVERALDLHLAAAVR
jgi:tagaturonate reductase